MTARRRSMAGVRRALLTLVTATIFAAPLLGCATRTPVRAPPRAPFLASPSDALPPDLDLVVRIDLARIRTALGPAGLALVRQGAESALTADALSELMRNALDRSDSAFFALRPELVPGEADNVLVLSGRFAELGVDEALRKAGWSAGVDLGGLVRRFDRPGKLSRSSAARLYAFGDERLVFVSSAEIDSVEAVLEGGLAPSVLRPKESGVLAFAARLRAFRTGLGARFPLLAGAVGDAVKLDGSVESASEGLELEMSLELPDEAGAERSANAFGKVRQAMATTDGKLGEVARSTETSAVGRFVVMRANLARGLP